MLTRAIAAGCCARDNRERDFGRSGGTTPVDDLLTVCVFRVASSGPQLSLTPSESTRNVESTLSAVQTRILTLRYNDFPQSSDFYWAGSWSFERRSDHFTDCFQGDYANLRRKDRCAWFFLACFHVEHLSLRGLLDGLFGWWSGWLGEKPVYFPALFRGGLRCSEMDRRSGKREQRTCGELGGKGREGSGAHTIARR